MGADVAQSLDIRFSADGAFSDVQVITSMGTNAPPRHQRCLLLS